MDVGILAPGGAAALWHRLGNRWHVGARLERLAAGLQSHHEQAARANAQRAIDVKLDDRPHDGLRRFDELARDPSEQVNRQRTIDVKLDDRPHDAWQPVDGDHNGPSPRPLDVVV